MPRDYRLYLRDMVDSARFIEEQGRNLTEQMLTADEVRLRALLQGLIVIGEAANHVPREIQASVPEVPWEDIVGIRNIIVHGYFSLNLSLIWDAVHHEVPALRRHLEVFLQALEGDEA